MSGKPAARQGDMTQYGGPIVQGSAGVRIGAPHRRGVLGVSGRDDFGQPGKSAAGGEGAARRDGPCAARPAAVHSLPHLQQLPDQDTRAGGSVWPRLESAF
ncbi:Rhs element protein [Escherichia coli]|uniref:Rhs element protein n=1 Tax=Escherichia coli TaxID=562 RepID=A0A376ZNN7_ECOLX|nr:Rhs element protein [Escherichia coli]